MSKVWPEIKLDDLLNVQNGFAFNSKQFSESGQMPLIRIRDLKSGIETKTRYSGEFDEKYIVRQGDLLIGMDGDFECHQWNGPDGLLNQRVCRLESFSDRLFPKFVFYGINKYLKEIEEVTAFTTVKHLSARQIKAIKFPVPPLHEQKRIVAILDEAFAGIDAAIANTEKNLANARELFEKFTSEVIFGDPEKQGWQKTNVSECTLPEKGAIRTGPFGSQLLHGEFVDSGIAVLGIDNAVKNRFMWGKKRYISEEKYEQLKRYTVRSGDVLITIMGTCGRCAIVPEDVPTAINTKHLCCISLDKSICLPEFLHAYFLYHPVARHFLESRAKGSIMAGLNMGIIKELPVWLPGIDEQRRVVARVGELYDEILRLQSVYEQKCSALMELKQSLLQKAFSGELTDELVERRLDEAVA